MALIRLFLKYLIGLCIISFFIWLYLLRERLPKDLTFDFSLYYIVLAISMIILHIFLIYRKMYPPKALPKNRVVLKLLSILLKLTDFLDSVYETIYLTIKELYIFRKFMIFISGQLFFIERSWPNQYIYIFLSIIPRFIVALCFFIDVCWFHRIEYFYIAVYLLILPLLLNIILYWVKKCAEDCRKEVLVYLIIDEKILLDPETSKTFSVYSYKWKEPNMEQTALFTESYLINHDLFGSKILEGLLELMQFDSYKKTKLLSICLSLLYIIAWGYMIYKIIFSLILIVIAIDITSKMI